jgi:hypothetical protein
LDEEITAEATPAVLQGGAVPTTYNWTIPGTYFDITAGSGSRVIKLKAKAAANSIASEIQVAAGNGCGTSGIYSNATPLTILDCSDVPKQPGDIIFDKTTVEQGNTFTASIDAVPGATSYVWTLPEGLSGSSDNNSIEITAVTDRTYQSGTVSVKAANDCGLSDGTSSTDIIYVSVPQCLMEYDGELCFSATNYGSMTRSKAIAFCSSLTSPPGAAGWRLPKGVEGMALCGLIQDRFWVSDVTYPQGHTYYNTVVLGETCAIVSDDTFTASSYGVRCVRSL